MKNILILGDSTSMTIGLEKRTYPFLLADEPLWPAGCTFVNFSQPGMTAADAAAYYFRQIKSYPDLGAVIIYLGNCEANASELKKGKYTLFRQNFHEFRDRLGIKPRKIRLRNKLLRFEWNNGSYRTELENPEASADFYYNLLRIIRSCKSKSIPVVLVRPRAHICFPAGIGKGNFIFYHYLNYNPKLADQLEHPENEFLRAYREYESGSYETARNSYKAILQNIQNNPLNGEYPVMLAHNYAMACAKSGRVSEAEVLLKTLFKERGGRQDIFLFNYASLRLLQDDQPGYQRYLEAAYREDSSMYRVKDDYLEQIDKIAIEFPDAIRLVDMGDLDDALFVDHCHLLKEGQELMACRVGEALRSCGVCEGSSRAGIENDLLNLELSFGNREEFYSYYKSYAVYPSGQMEREMSRLEDEYKRWGQWPEDLSAVVSFELSRAIKYYRQHPCFSSPVDILRFPPQHPCDIGRFPEFYLLRKLLGYFRAMEADEKYTPPVSYDSGLLHKADDYFSILPPEAKHLKEIIVEGMDDDVDLWIDRIITNVKASLTIHLCKGSQIHERVLTTIFWYFRETLRWGAHSRYSMLYDRLVLEFAAEALAVAGWLDYRAGGERRNEIIQLGQQLEVIVDLHEMYVRQYSPILSRESFFDEYRQALNVLLEKMKTPLAEKII